MSNSVPLQIAETIQTASINKAPSPAHDLNPSTAASKKQPVTLEHPTAAPASDSSTDKYVYDEDVAIDDEEDITYNVLKPTPRRQSMGPMPDLRFEQSYLASIANADTKWKVAMITIRDQFFMPLLQGMLWSLALHGWRYWNRSANLRGNGVGARVRRWWYEINDWPLREKWDNMGAKSNLAVEIGDYDQKQSTSD